MENLVTVIRTKIKKMLKPLVIFFSLFAFFIIFHFSTNKEVLPNVKIDYAKGWKVRQPWDIKVEEGGEDDIDYLDGLKMTTEHFRPTDGGPKFSVEFLRRYYSQQASARSSQLQRIRENTNFATLYNVLVPEVYCPNLMRVGNVNDGGKWVCNPMEMPQENCSIYSLGLRDDVTFDREIQSFNNFSCKIYGYDAVENYKAFHGYKDINGIATKIKISAVTNLPGESTLEDLLRSHGDNYTEFLKMDIEGTEYNTLPQFLSTTKVCQLFLEMHGKSYKMRDLLVTIARNGYYLFFYEVNGDSLEACEYSFIHKDCMDRYGAFILAPYLNNSGVVG